MRKKISSILFIAVVGLFVQNVLAQQFTPPNEGFTVWLNGKPTPDIRTGDTSFGKLTVKLYLVATPNGAHGVAVNQYPFATEDPDKIEKSIDGGIASLIAGRKGKMISEKPVTLGEHKGKEVYFSFPGGVGRAKIFLVKYNLYQILTLGKSPYVNSASMKRSFDSFALTDESVGEKWAMFTSNPARFAALFPSKPRFESTKLGAEGGKTLFQYTFTVGSESEEYGIVVTDMNKEFAVLPKDEVLKYLRRSLDPSLSGEQLEIQIDGEQGIEFFTTIESQKTKVWSVVKYDKSFQIFFRGSDTKLASAEVKSFFESFKFVTPTPAKAKRKTD